MPTRYIAILSIGLAVSAVAAQPASDGVAIVDKHAIVLDKPVGGPTKFMPQGPLLGNGDVGVMQSGPAEQLVFYIGKNDFWTIKHQAPIAVGQLRILTPAMHGAKFQTTCDMRRAEIRGEYATGSASLASRARVDANRNLFCVELANKGATPLAISVQNIMGCGGEMPPSGVPVAGPAKIGCEQHGGARWFFSGEMADVKVVDRAMASAEISALAAGKPQAVQAFDGKTANNIAAPVVSKSLTISGWVKASVLSPEANYIVSTGEWSKGYSLGLSAGKPRFAIGGFTLQGDQPIPLDRWVHVAGVFDGKQMSLLVDGKILKSVGAAGDAGDNFLYYPDAPNPDGRRIGLATRVIGEATREFTLQPGKTAVVATAILSDLDVEGKDPRTAATAMVAGLTAEKITASTAAHRQWWEDFWKRSFIEIPDKVIEQCWYSSWYVMGSCSRAGKVAPGLWGNWLTTDSPAWHGDFHLNYNFQAPFYGLYSANHPETTLPFYEAMNQSIPRGKKIAESRGWKGVHLPVSIGPWGMCPEGDNSDWGQRSNTVYAAMLYLWYWQYTRDTEWLKSTGYPYLREVATFWENYLKLETGPDGKPRYVIYNDSIHEGSGADFNPIVSLGMVKTLFRNMIPISEAIGADADKRGKWQDIRDKLSAFPLQEKDGKTIFRYTEKGHAWWRDNVVGIQHIFPGGAIGLDSDPKLLEISRNMIDAMGRWRDYNGSSSWYAACARVGYDPKVILAKLREMYNGHTLPNKLLNFGGGGIENVSPAMAVTEMLMQSHEGVIRLFPCWPMDQDARFGTLRANGAFLVSADLKGGVISGVKITSGIGLACTVQNPWPGKSVRVIRDGKAAENACGPRLAIKTTKNETIELQPVTIP